MAHREGVTEQTHEWTLIPASSLIESQKVIEIDSSLPVEEACNVLIENNISSAPVYYTVSQEESNASKKPVVPGKFHVGMFDYGDVIAYLLLVLRQMTPPIDDDSSELFEIKDIVRRANEGKRVPVKLACDLSERNPFCSILPETTLLSAVEELASGTHRVCVLKPDGSIKGILSQSTISKFFYDKQNDFPLIKDLFSKTLRQLGLGQTEVVSVSSDAIVLDALSQMISNGVSSVAVLGHMGVILGNISMTDVKHVMNSYRYQLLWYPSFKFISLVRTQQGIDDGQDCLPVFDVRLDTTLGFSIAKLLATRSHRVWVTDERDRAIGVLSMTDIMRAIAAKAEIQTLGPRRGSLSASHHWM